MRSLALLCVKVKPSALGQGPRAELWPPSSAALATRPQERFSSQITNSGKIKLGKKAQTGAQGSYMSLVVYEVFSIATETLEMYQFLLLPILVSGLINAKFQ